MDRDSPKVVEEHEEVGQEGPYDGGRSHRVAPPPPEEHGPAGNGTQLQDDEGDGRVPKYRPQ